MNVSRCWILAKKNETQLKQKFKCALDYLQPTNAQIKTKETCLEDLSKGVKSTQFNAQFLQKLAAKINIKYRNRLYGSYFFQVYKCLYCLWV